MIRLALAFALLCACTPRSEPALELRIEDTPVAPERRPVAVGGDWIGMHPAPVRVPTDPGIHGAHGRTLTGSPKPSTVGR